jgi:hypothetical protein
MDCSTDSRASFRIEGKSIDSVLVTVTSFFSNQNGRVKLVKKNGKLYWSLVDAPKGEYYFPHQAILVRDK